MPKTNRLEKRTLMQTKLILKTAIMSAVMLLSYSALCASDVAQLQAKLLNVSDAKDKITILNALGSTYWRANKYDSATFYYKQALVICEEQGSPEISAKVFDNLGLVNQAVGKYDSALYYYKKSLTNWRIVNYQKDYASTVNHIGSMFLLQNLFDSALMRYREALDIRVRLADSTSIAQSLNNIATAYKNFNNTDSALVYINRTIAILQKINNQKSLADAYNNLGGIYWQDKRYKESLQNYLLALDIREQLGDNNVIASTMNNIGLIYKDLGNFDKALEYYNKSLEQYEETHDTFRQSEALNLIGGVYWQSGNYKSALDVYKRVLQMRITVGDKRYIARAHNNIALVFKNLNERDSSLAQYQAALEIYNQLGDKKSAAGILNNIANLYLKFNNHTEAEHNFKLALDQRRAISDHVGVAYTELDLGQLLVKQKKHQHALPILNDALNRAQRLKNSELEKDVRLAMAQTYAVGNDFKKAYENLESYTALKDSILSLESVKRIADMQISYETEKKEKALKIKDIQILQQEEKNRRQFILIMFSVVVLLVVSVFAVLIANQNKKVRKANELLDIKNKQILQQNEEIERQRDFVTQQRDQIAMQKEKITDSIEYASRIQNAMLPPINMVNALIPNKFILFRPRDIVSGDFYWAANCGQYTVIAAVDCTGHGVPGAFMSMLGLTLLNQIASKGQINNAAHILEQMRGMVKTLLHQQSRTSGANDGMDCALCMIDQQNYKLQFAGANNPVFIVRNGELIEIEPDRMPIGIHLTEEEPFTNNEFDLMQGDKLYIFSDGYADQFGGKNGRKLLTKNFKNLLVESSQLSMDEQKTKLNQYFDEWKGNFRQLDDVLVIGIKID